MAAANILSETPILKTLYPQDDIKREMSQLSSLFALVEKREDFVGANIALALRIAATSGRSRVFQNAQANKAGSVLGKFTVTRVKDYSVYSIDGETIDACGEDEGAIVDAVTTEVDAAMDAIKLNTGRSIYRNFGGAIGAIASSSNVATTQIALNDPNTAIFFEDGQVLNSAPTDGTSGTVNAGANVITTMDNTTGIMLGAVVWNVAIPNISAVSNGTFGDYLFTDGDFGNSCAGLDSWTPAGTIPLTAVPPLFGLTRNVSSRYIGTRAVSTSGQTPEEALQRGLQQVYRQGGFRAEMKSKYLFENDQDFLALGLSLGTRVLYNDVEVDAEIGFEGIKVVGPGGPVTVLADSNCQQGTAWGPDMESTSFRSLKEFPRFLDLDKLGRMVREVSADSYEGRIGGYYQWMTDAPVRTLRCPL